MELNLKLHTCSQDSNNSSKDGKESDGGQEEQKDQFQDSVLFMQNFRSSKNLPNQNIYYQQQQKNFQRAQKRAFQSAIIQPIQSQLIKQEHQSSQQNNSSSEDDNQNKSNNNDSLSSSTIRSKNSSFHKQQQQKQGQRKSIMFSGKKMSLFQFLHKKDHRKKSIKKNIIQDLINYGKNLSDNLSPAKSSRMPRLNDHQKKLKIFNFQEKNVDQVIEILKKRAWTRTEEEMDIVEKYAMDIKFFEQYFGHERGLFRTLAHHYTHVRVKKGQYLFNQGDKPNGFYLLLSGIAEIQKKNNVMDKSNKNEKVKNLFPGDSVGELGMLTGESRKATVYCIQDCDFARFGQRIYDDMIKKIEEKKWNFRIALLSNQYYFKEFSSQSLSNIYLMFTEQNFRKNEYIFKEDQESDYLYIVQEGQFIFSKSIDQQEKLEFGQIKSRCQKKPKIVNIGIVTEGTSFGELEFFLNINRQFSAKCNSIQGKLLCLQKQTFMKSMGQFMTVMEKINARVEKQNKLFQRTIQKAQKRQQNIDDEFKLRSNKKQDQKIMKAYEQDVNSAMHDLIQEPQKNKADKSIVEEAQKNWDKEFLKAKRKNNNKRLNELYKEQIDLCDRKRGISQHEQEKLKKNREESPLKQQQLQQQMEIEKRQGLGLKSQKSRNLARQASTHLASNSSRSYGKGDDSSERKNGQKSNGLSPDGRERKLSNKEIQQQIMRKEQQQHNAQGKGNCDKIHLNYFKRKSRELLNQKGHDIQQLLQFQDNDDNNQNQNQNRDKRKQSGIQIVLEGDSFQSQTSDSVVSSSQNSEQQQFISNLGEKSKEIQLKQQQQKQQKIQVKDIGMEENSESKQQNDSQQDNKNKNKKKISVFKKRKEKQKEVTRFTQKLADYFNKGKVLDKRKEKQYQQQNQNIQKSKDYFFMDIFDIKKQAKMELETKFTRLQKKFVGQQPTTDRKQLVHQVLQHGKTQKKLNFNRGVYREDLQNQGEREASLEEKINRKFKEKEKEESMGKLMLNLTFLNNGQDLQKKNNKKRKSQFVYQKYQDQVEEEIFQEENSCTSRSFNRLNNSIVNNNNIMNSSSSSLNGGMNYFFGKSFSNNNFNNINNNSSRYNLSQLDKSNTFNSINNNSNSYGNIKNKSSNQGQKKYKFHLDLEKLNKTSNTTNLQLSNNSFHYQQNSFRQQRHDYFNNLGNQSSRSYREYQKQQQGNNLFNISDNNKEKNFDHYFQKSNNNNGNIKKLPLKYNLEQIVQNGMQHKKLNFGYQLVSTPIKSDRCQTVVLNEFY